MKTNSTLKLLIILNLAFSPSFALSQARVAPAQNNNGCNCPDLPKAKMMQEINRLKSLNLKTQKEKQKLTQDLNKSKKQLAQKKEAAVADLKNALNSSKYVDLSFGVLPNSDDGINNYASLKLNFTENLSSGFLFTSRQLGTSEVKNREESGPQSVGIDKFTIESTSSNVTSREKFSLDILRWKMNEINLLGSKFESSLVFGVTRVSETKTSRLTERKTFNDPADNEALTIVSNSLIEETNNGRLPKLGFELKNKIGGKLEAAFAMAVLAGNQETVHWQETGSAYVPAISKSKVKPEDEFPASLIESKDSREIDYTSQGYTMDATIRWHGKSHGFGLKLSILEKEGERKAFKSVVQSAPEVYDANGNLTNEGQKVRTVEELDIFENRFQSILGFEYSMNFLKSYGFIPILTVNMEEFYVTTTEKDKTAKTVESKQIDVGFIFKY